MARDAPPRFRALTPVEARAELDRGAIPIDIREPAVFGAGHLVGSINVPFSARRFAERVASVVAADAIVLLLGDHETRVLAASSALADSALDFRGYLTGGLAAGITAGFATSSLAAMSVEDLRRDRAERQPGWIVVDVREPVEWEELGRIEGAILIPLGELVRRRSEIPKESPIALICEQGIRSSTAASVLARFGFTRLANVAGGMAGWRMAGFPVIE